MITCGELLVKGTRLLREKEIEASRLEAEVLLAFAWGRSRTDLLIFSNDLVPGSIEEKFYDILQQRGCGVPVAYLTGEKEFMSLPFYVNPSVLIPRPETELIVEKVLEHFADREEKGAVGHLAADVGTGSGAVAVSLAYYNPRLRLKAVDISARAIQVAARNARRHEVADRVEFLQGDLLSLLIQRGSTGVGHAVVANLPYIPTADLHDLPRDVHYEPNSALDGGEDGLELYRRLAPQASVFLAPGGLIACEVGPDQAEQLARILSVQGWEEIQIVRDYAGRERIVIGVFGG